MQQHALSHSSTLGRRQFLTSASLGLAGLSLSTWLPSEELLAASPLASGKSVIFVFQQGGPSQFETFDPKIDAPVEIRTVNGVTQTALPGVTFGGTMTRLAKRADKLTIVRSFQTDNGGHNIHTIMGPHTLNANMGSLFSRIAGSTVPSTGMPTNAVLFPQTVDDKVTKGNARGDILATGQLGSVYAPFIPGGGGELQKAMKLNMPADRLGDRRELLAQIERINRQMTDTDLTRDIGKVHEQAYQVLLDGGVAKALDFTLEDESTLAAYDTAPFVRPDGWSKSNRGKRGYYTGQAKTFGKLMLLARRLCEAGCGFVTVHADYEGVWDMHADGNNLNMQDGMEAVGHSFDHGISAFIDDVESRGLQDKIMLVCTGEMGRTPKLNKNGGRDHWGKLAPLLVYGGGASRGRVIGQSTRDGGEPATDRYNCKNLVSTILHTQFDVGQLRLQPGLQLIGRLGEVPPIPVFG